MSTKVAFSSKSTVFVTWAYNELGKNFLRAYNTTTWEQIWEINLDSDYLIDFSSISFSKSGQYFSILTTKNIPLEKPFKSNSQNNDEMNVAEKCGEIEAIFVNVIKTLTGEIVSQFWFRPRLDYYRVDYVCYNEKNVVIVDKEKDKYYVFLYDLNGNLIKRFMLSNEILSHFKLENDILTYRVIGGKNCNSIGNKSVNIYTQVSTPLVKNTIAPNNISNKDIPPVEQICPNRRYAICFNHWGKQKNANPNAFVYDIHAQKTIFEIKSNVRLLRIDYSRNEINVVCQQRFIDGWDLETGRLKLIHINPFSHAKFIFNHDSSLLAVLDASEHVTIYKTATGEKMQVIYPFKQEIKKICKLDNGKSISWEDGKLKFIEAENIKDTDYYKHSYWFIDEKFDTGNSYDIVFALQFKCCQIIACHRDGSLSYHHSDTLETIQTLQASFIPHISR